MILAIFDNSIERFLSDMSDKFNLPASEVAEIMLSDPAGQERVKELLTEKSHQRTEKPLEDKDIFGEEETKT